MEEEKLTRTSFSLPKNIFDKLNEAERPADISASALLMLCLKRFIRGSKITQISERATCQYSETPVQGVMKIYLSTEEHHNLKMLRIVLGQSVSFLVVQAVLRHLDAVCRLLRQMAESDWRRNEKWKRFQDEMFTKICRVLSFSAKNFRGLLGIRIVIHRPVLRWKKILGKIPKPKPMPQELRDRLQI